ncbi:coiled-coil domain-containing protein 9 [Lonchura striata]
MDFAVAFSQAAALEKDAELDRRIAALRRKNEALVRRYQEIEEDRRRAEREGGFCPSMPSQAFAGRRGSPERNPVRNFLDDPRRRGPEPGGSAGGTSATGGAPTWAGPRPGVPGVPLDPTLWMTGRQRAEYERWKRERERIDRERLQRHRDARGAWRREWDAQKPDGMWVWGKKRGFRKKKWGF